MPIRTGQSFRQQVVTGSILVFSVLFETLGAAERFSLGRLLLGRAGAR